MCVFFFQMTDTPFGKWIFGGWRNGLGVRRADSQVWFPALSWWRTNKYHLSSRSSNALFRPLRVLRSHGIHTHTHLYKIKNLKAKSEHRLKSLVEYEPFWKTHFHPQCLQAKFTDSCNVSLPFLLQHCPPTWSERTPFFQNEKLHWLQ